VRLVADEVAVLRLRTLDQLGEVVRLLERDNEIVADLDDLDAPQRQRALDVLSGVAYALDASMCRYQPPRYRYRITRAN
jgi:FtsZ-interacting cell division protein YlmF